MLGNGSIDLRKSSERPTTVGEDHNCLGESLALPKGIDSGSHNAMVGNLLTDIDLGYLQVRQWLQ
jgi:hypothetical protein